MCRNDNLIKLSVKGRHSHKMTLAEKAIFDAFDIFYLDDEVLFESELREEIMCFASLSETDLNEYSDQRFRHLVDELSFQIKQMSNSQWDSFLSGFWVFYDKSPFGFVAAKDSVFASFMRVVTQYLISVDEEDKRYSNKELVGLLTETEKIIDKLDIHWAKNHLSPYIEKDVIQLFRLSSLLEEVVFDTLIDELDDDILYDVLIAD